MREAATPRREPWIEAARALACGLVVLMHVDAFARAGMDTWWPGGYAIGPLLCVTVPAFLMLAGWLQAEPGRGTRPGWLSSRLRRLLLPMVAWSAVMLLLGANAGRRSPVELVLDLTTGVQHLYYLGVLAQITLVVAVLDRLGRRTFSGTALVAAAAVSVLSLAIAEVGLWSGGDAFGSVENWLRRLALPWALFYFFGGWLRGRQLDATVAPFRGWMALGLAAAGGYALYVAMFVLEEHAFGYVPRTELLLGGLPFQLAGGWLGLALVERWARSGRAGWLLSLLAAGGRDSYGIYLAHFPVLIGTFALWSRVVGPFTGEVPALWLLTWIGSQLVVRALRAAGAWPRVLLLGEASARRAPARAEVSPPPAPSPQAPRTAPAGS